VQRIFGTYPTGYGIFPITEALTPDGIPSPSAQVRARNRHRGSGLVQERREGNSRNTRYAGRQVGNKQRSDEVPFDINDVALGHTAILRWHRPEQWVKSKKPAHEALIEQPTLDRTHKISPGGHAPESPYAGATTARRAPRHSRWSGPPD
jgi:hypothetical protein